MSIKFRVTKCQIRLGEHAGQSMQIASLARSGRVDFRQFCEEVATGSTVMTADVKAVFDRAVRIIQYNVAHGRSVEIEELGTFYPTVGSIPVPEGQEFNARLHLRQPRVGFRAKPTFRTLRDARLEQMTEEEAAARDAVRRSKVAKAKAKGEASPQPPKEVSPGTEGDGSGSSTDF